MKITDKIYISLLTELNKRNGLDTIILPRVQISAWECDILTLNSRGYSTEYEIKISKADFIKDFNKCNYFWNNELKDYELIYKHNKLLYDNRVNKFYFVIPKSFLLDSKLMEMINAKYGIITWDLDDENIILDFYKEAKFLNKLQNKEITKDKLNKLLLVKYHYLYKKLLKTKGV